MKLIEDEKCPKCGKLFQCSKSGKCWCFEVNLTPAVLVKIEKDYISCLCPSCLNGFVEKSEL